MKYIDTEKLISEIEREKKVLFEIGGDTFENKWACGSLDRIKATVISLMHEQDYLADTIKMRTCDKLEMEKLYGEEY